MSKVIGLFPSQLEAGKVTRALAQDKFADLSVEVIEEWVEPGGVIAAPIAGVSPTPAAVPVASPFDTLAGGNLSDNVLHFLQNGVRGGGVVIAVAADGARETAVKQLMEDHGGKFAVEE